MITKDEINELKEEFNKRISELENKLEQKQSAKRRRPKYGEHYYFICDCGCISSNIYKYMPADGFRYLQNNCFKTKMEAQEHLENLKTKAELKALAEELNGDEVIDWKDEEQKKYYIYYIRSGGCHFLLFRGVNDTFQTQGTIHCLNPRFLDIATTRIGEDRLIKMIKSGV